MLRTRVVCPDCFEQCVNLHVCCGAGASFLYETGVLPFEAQEVRAFGLLVADMAARIPAGGDGNRAGNGGFWARFWPSNTPPPPSGAGGSITESSVKKQLSLLAEACTQPSVSKRPSFSKIVTKLQELAVS